MLKVPVIVFKDSSSFRHLVAVSCAFHGNGSKKQKIVALHINGVKFNSLEPKNQAARDRLLQIYKNMLPKVNESSEKYKVNIFYVGILSPC